MDSIRDIGDDVKASVVKLILEKRTEEALDLLSRTFKVDVPGLKVGHRKGHKKVLAVYVEKLETIFVAEGDGLWNPFIIIHEFYHHLRSRTGRHRGNEKLADEFAISFIVAYRDQLSKGLGSRAP